MRDFRGISGRSFDGRGNYNVGVKEQIIFPEIEYDKVDALRGLNISITTTAKTDEECQGTAAGFPFPVQELRWRMAKVALISANSSAKTGAKYAAKRRTEGGRRRRQAQRRRARRLVWRCKSCPRNANPRASATAARSPVVRAAPSASSVWAAPRSVNWLLLATSPASPKASW